MNKYMKDRRLWLLLLAAAAGILLLTFGGDRILGGKRESTPEASPEAVESRLAELVGEIEGIGQVRVFTRFENGQLCGAAILCEGGDDPAVQKGVIELLTALYGLGSHRIYVGRLRGS